MELQANLPKIQSQQLGLAAISYDSPAILKDFAQRKGITFPLLSDADSQVIRAYGILNETMDRQSPYFGVPYPGTFLLDAKGRVVSKHFEDDYRERYTASEILTRQFGVELGVPHETIETPQLRLSTSASTTTVRWGQRISLMIDVDLKGNKMHVYAPGVEHYIPIEWTLADSPAFKTFPATYPGSQRLRLEAIQETVPVYHGRFRIVRDVTLAGDPKVKPLLNSKGELEIAGTLRYQACDDRICYPPRNVPVKWTVDYEEVDRQRVPAELQRKPRP